MPTVGQAYVQIVPSAQGLSSAIRKELDKSGLPSEGTKAGMGFGKKMIGAVAALGIGATIVSGIKKSLGEGAALQQSMGGVETLFKKNADTVIKNARNAYKTSGLSANQYMEQVTSFSASLLQSLDGDTKKAAKSADMAMRDMSDNSNKFGTDMGSITMAYQGFAKQNYTMLDNLKLGYGGTKEEMERLLQDAGKLSGQKYDISSLDDVYQAIHVIQDEMGITGTTAKEASSTFSGSFNSMKAAAQNVLGALSTGENLGPALQALGDTMSTFVAENLIPMLGQIADQIPMLVSTAIQGLTDALPDMSSFVTNALNNLTAAISGEGGSKMLEAGLNIMTQFGNALGTNIAPIVTAAGMLIGNLAQQIITHLPQILSCAGGIVLALCTGIAQGLNPLADAASNLMVQFDQAIESFVQTTLAPAGAAIVNTIVTAVKSKFGEVSTAITEKMKSVKSSITNVWNGIKSSFTGAISSIKARVTAGFSAVQTKIVTPVKTAVNKVKGFVNNIKKHLSFSGLAGKVASVFNQVKTKITTPLEKAKNTLSKLPGKIVGYFRGLAGKIASAIGKITPKVRWETLTVKGAKTPLKVPHVHFRKAMTEPYMFDKETTFAAGEAGDEMLYGRAALMRDIRNATASAKQTTVTNYITVDGAENPEDWARRFARTLTMEARMA